MRKDQVEQIAVIFAETAEQFQKAFNSTMADLADKNPKYEFNHAQGFCAYITYKETTCVHTEAADEFHAQGISYKCKNCPLHETETDGRKKHIACKFAELGRTHLNKEACDVFWRRLKMGDLQPVGAPGKWGEKTMAKGNKENDDSERRYFAL